MLPSLSIATIERVLPRLALDFTTASLDPRITFVRSLNTATRVNSSGYVETVNANVPRFDYDPITLACKGLLIEEGRTNLCWKSEEFNDAAWFKSACTVSENAAISPNGNQTADRMIEGSGTVFPAIMYNYPVNIVSGTTYTFTVYAKANGRTILGIYYQDATFPSSGRVAWFNLSNQTTTAQSGVVATITNAGSGWYRCSITATADASSSGFSNSAAMFVASGMGGASSITGDGSSGFYLWGAQLEAGAFPTSYIPTTTTEATRNADVATMTGTNFSDWYNASEGAVQVNYQRAMGVPLITAGVTAEFSDGTTSNRIQFSINSSGDTAFVTGGSGFSSQVATNNVTKTILGIKQNLFAHYVSGNQITVATGNVPTLSKLNIGSRFDNSNYLNGHIRQIYYWKQRLLNSELQAFTK